MNIYMHLSARWANIPYKHFWWSQKVPAHLHRCTEELQQTSKKSPNSFDMSECRLCIDSNVNKNTMNMFFGNTLGASFTDFKKYRADEGGIWDKNHSAFNTPSRLTCPYLAFLISMALCLITKSSSGPSIFLPYSDDPHRSYCKNWSGVKRHKIQRKSILFIAACHSFHYGIVNHSNMILMAPACDKNCSK